MHYVIRQTVPHIDNSISKKMRRSYLAGFFCNLKSLPLVVRVGDVVKFGIAAESYLPDSVLQVSTIDPLIRRLCIVGSLQIV